MRSTLAATVWPAFPALLLASLLASCSAPIETVEIVRMAEVPGDGIFRLARTGLQVRVADFGNALYGSDQAMLVRWEGRWRYQPEIR